MTVAVKNIVYEKAFDVLHISYSCGVSGALRCLATEVITEVHKNVLQGLVTMVIIKGTQR